MPADQLPLPEAKLKDDVEDAIRGEAEELPAIGQEEAALATAAAAIPGQQPMATDAIAALPMGQALRQEALVQGHTWAFETGKLARLANGSCLVQCGNTTVLAAATCQLPPWSRREAQSLQFEVRLLSACLKVLVQAGSPAGLQLAAFVPGCLVCVGCTAFLPPPILLPQV